VSIVETAVLPVLGAVTVIAVPVFGLICVTSIRSFVFQFVVEVVATYQ